MICPEPMSTRKAGARPAWSATKYTGDEVGGQVEDAAAGIPDGEHRRPVGGDVECRLVEMLTGAVDHQLGFGPGPIRKFHSAGPRGRDPVEAAVAGADVVVPVADGIRLEKLGGDAALLAGLVLVGVLLQGGGAGVGADAEDDYPAAAGDGDPVDPGRRVGQPPGLPAAGGQEPPRPPVVAPLPP